MGFMEGMEGHLNYGEGTKGGTKWDLWNCMEGHLNYGVTHASGTFDSQACATAGLI